MEEDASEILKLPVKEDSLDVATSKESDKGHVAHQTSDLRPVPMPMASTTENPHPWAIKDVIKRL